jgi:carotenoid cleavage oxygenase
MTTTAPPTTQSENPYLSGNWAPVRHEVTATDLEVTGSIPEYLDGRYLRIGPNPREDPDPQRYHVFLGEGMVHGLRLRDGNAQWYRNRWVRRGIRPARNEGTRRPGGWHDVGIADARRRSHRRSRGADMATRRGREQRRWRLPNPCAQT